MKRCLVSIFLVTIIAPSLSPAAAAAPAAAKSSVASAAEKPSAVSLYVSPRGNDAWSGTLADANAAGTDGPVATLDRARDLLRELKGKGPLPAGGATVWVRGGAYYLAKTFELAAADSGTPEAPVVYRAYAGEKPSLVGGQEVRGFLPHQGAILKADLAGQGLKGAAFRQLFFASRRQHLARYPNFDPKNPYGGGWAYADGKPIAMYADVVEESRRLMMYKEQDARPWANPQEAEVWVFPRYNWWNNIVRIASVDRAAREIKLARDCSYPIRPGDRYFVQGAMEELDAPGEWYLDTRTSTLYFWPPEPLAGKAVVAPRLKTIVQMGPDTAHVTLRGFTIECSEGTGVVLQKTTACLIAACTIRNVGDYSGSGVSVAGGTRNRVAGNDIHDVGSHGVSLDGGDRPTLTAAENIADNNYIHHTGVYHKQGVGVSLRGVGNVASHNYIHDGPRMGIMFSGNNLIIEFNHIRHVNLETADTGAVYTGGRDWISSRGTKIRYNYFHDILGYGREGDRWISPHYAWGVYLDDNTGGVDVIGNIVAGCIRGLVHFHNGRDNLVENNVFIGGTLQQFECSGWTPAHRYWTTHMETMLKGYDSVASQPAWKGMRHMDLHPSKAVLPDNTIMAGNVVRRNIFTWTDPKATYVKYRNMSLADNTFDENVVWACGNPVKIGGGQMSRGTGPNLVANPGFEEGAAGALPAGWSWKVQPAGAKAALAAAAAAGKLALEIEGAEGKDAKGKSVWPMLGGPEIAVKPGQTYRLTARMKAGQAGTKVGFGASWAAAKGPGWSREATATVAAEWATAECAFKIPAEGDRDFKPEMKAVRVRIDMRAAPGKLWVDELSLKEVTPIDTWEAWQAAGEDRRSIVADPLFVAPEKGDYRLRPESPALKMGFKPIPVEEIGPYADPLRASWPIVEAPGAREMPLNN